MDSPETQINQKSINLQNAPSNKSSDGVLEDDKWDATPPYPHKHTSHLLILGFILILILVGAIGGYFFYKVSPAPVKAPETKISDKADLLKSLGITDEKTQGSLYTLSVIKKHLKQPLPEIEATSTIDAANVPIELKNFVLNFIKPDSVKDYESLNFADGSNGYEVDVQKNVKDSPKGTIWELPSSGTDSNNQKLVVANSLTAGRGVGIGEFEYLGKYIYVFYYEPEGTDASTVGQVITLVK